MSDTSAAGRGDDRSASERSVSFATVVKWVGGITAIMSLIAGLYQFGRFVHDSRERRQHVAELLQVAENQRERHQFQEAWQSLEAADRLGSEPARVRRAREELAMFWTENVRARQGETFTQAVAKLEPVLDRGLADATGQRKADLLAHLGWAMFLRYREGSNDAPPDDMYRKALAADPTNVYAHAMLGHWILWDGHDVPAARKHFAAAVDAGRVTAYVRSLEFAALENTGTGEGRREMLTVANDMRKRQESMADPMRDKLWSVYRSVLLDVLNSGRGRLADELDSAVPPEEHLATFRWLFDADQRPDIDTRIDRLAWIGSLQEAVGHRDEAVASFTQLAKLLDGNTGSRAGFAQAALKRLDASPAQVR